MATVDPGSTLQLDAPTGDDGGKPPMSQNKKIAIAGGAVAALVLIYLYVKSKSASSTSSSTTTTGGISPGTGVPEVIYPSSGSGGGGGGSRYNQLLTAMNNNDQALSSQISAMQLANQATTPSVATSATAPSVAGSATTATANAVGSSAQSYAGEQLSGSGYGPPPGSSTVAAGGKTYTPFYSPVAAGAYQRGGGQLYFQPAQGIFQADTPASHLAQGTPLYGLN